MRLTKIKKTYLVAATALAVGAMICLPRFASAKVTGVCSNCHTMHNSQDNKPMTFGAGGFSTTGGSSTPNNTLLRGNCLECHTGTNAGATNSDTTGGGGTPPYVFSVSLVPAYGTDTLAGGNFYWADQTGSTADGHNVDELPNNPTDAVLAAPPGYTGSTWTSTITLATNPLTCAGTYGCHGDRSIAGNFAAISGAHHTDPGGGKTGLADTTVTPNITKTANSFRFLNGVTGTEVSDWEYAASSSSHNEYKGAARSGDSADDSTTISSLCAQCHGAFHNSTVSTYTNANGTAVTAGIQGTAWGSPWIRHPTDYDMNNKGSGTEYAAYAAYDPMVPVGHSILNGTTIDSTAYGDAGGAIVMCISCHRAHGSPYADLLRWDYSTMVAGGGAPTTGLGCFTCHTTKD